MKGEERLPGKREESNKRGRGQERAKGNEYDQTPLNTHMKMSQRDALCTINI